GIPDRGLMPAAILVRPEARHDIEGQARDRHQAPEHRGPANFLVSRRVLDDEPPAGTYEPAPPEARTGPDDHQLCPDEASEILCEFWAGGVNADRPSVSRDIPP